jgi:putative SOS response-associated peptidase YedK
MCGRYDLSENPAAIRARFHVPSVPEFAPNADWRPTDQAPIIRRARESTDLECVLARWGLVPWWAKELKFGTHTINARSETVATQPSFRDAFKARRCLVPVNAFYEWSGPKGHRTKWRIRVTDEGIFSLAGLWERWRDPESGEGLETYTIITTAANEAIAKLHDRMPVILRPQDEERWLDPKATGKDLLVPFDPIGMAIEARSL